MGPVFVSAFPALTRCYLVFVEFVEEVAGCEYFKSTTDHHVESKS